MLCITRYKNKSLSTKIANDLERVLSYKYSFPVCFGQIVFLTTRDLRIVQTIVLLET